jgi:pSer/pThr/pTyr-binding forkhead associated (FHA) protein
VSSCPACGDDARLGACACGFNSAVTQRFTRGLAAVAPPPPPPPPPPPTQRVTARPASGRTERTHAYLVSSLLGRPFPLRSQGVTVIGRDKASHVVLPVPHVSRQHATISFANGTFTLEDRGSLNGTHVNGAPISAHRLAHGDVISIGPFELTFRLAAEPLTEPLGTDTVLLAVPSGIVGHTGGVTLPELWQLIEMHAKTGVLTIETSLARGRVEFEAGRAVHADTGAIEGEQAALYLLAGGAGTFRFTAGPRPSHRCTIRRPPGWLLFEAAKLADEASA